MSHAGAERRRHPRVTLDVPVSLRSQAHEAQLRLKDISRSGICCRVPFTLPEMTKVAMTIDLPADEGTHPIEVEGVVVRCEPTADAEPTSRPHELAIFFTELTAQSAQILETFLRQRLAATAH